MKAARAVVLAGLAAIATGTAASRWTIGIDAQAIQCLPGSRIVIRDRWAGLPERGEVYAFRAAGLAPVFPEGATLFKVVDAVPGDEVAVSAEGVRVNGRLVVEGLPLAEKLGVSPEAFREQYIVPGGKYLLLGRTPQSYDGRYWGLVDHSQLVGKVFQWNKEWL